jgi:hypothetical protein
MEVKWETIPTIVQTALERSIRSNQNDFTMGQLLIFLKGCEGMDFKWITNTELRSAVFEIIRTRKIRVSSILALFEKLE